ncbi:MAG: TonB-dependent receptor, partial [Syntrophorhabdaceae bacterium]|nr:TonB-dependent receptor [Syntrophorhabdaceae bacterium]
DGGSSIKCGCPDITIFSPYFAVSQMFGRKEGFHIIPSGGLRYYQNSEFRNKTATQAGLVLGYENTDISFNYARGVNYPSPVVLQNFLPNMSMPSGFDTGKIKPEVVDHYEAGVTHTWKDIGVLSVTFFRDNGRDRTRAYMFGGSPDESFFNSSTARYKIRGMELSGSLTPVENSELFAGVAWLKARATGDDGVEQRKMPYTPGFAFQAGFKWRFLNDLQFSGDYQYLRDVYAATSVRRSDPSNPSSNFDSLTDIDRLPDVNVVNLRLDYLFKYEKMHIKEGNIFLAFGNVFGAKYAYAKTTDGANYYMPGRTFMVGSGLKF